MKIPIAIPCRLMILSLCLGQPIDATLANPIDTNESRSRMTVKDVDIAISLKQCSPSPSEIAADIKKLELMPAAQRCVTEVSFRTTNCNAAAWTCRHTPEAPRCQEFLRMFGPANATGSGIEILP